MNINICLYLFLENEVKTKKNNNNNNKKNSSNKVDFFDFFMIFLQTILQQNLKELELIVYIIRD